MSHDDAFAAFQARRERERAERPKVTWRMRGDGWIGGAGGQARIFARRAGDVVEYGTRTDGVVGTTEKLHDAKRAAEALL